MVSEGATVLLVAENGTRYIVKAMRGMIEVRGLGVADGDAICDSSIGDIVTIAGRPFRMIKPSIRDMLAAIERRAQIISPKDGFIIPMYLDIGCGSRVAEAGAGSGAMTLVLLKAVAPDGRVYTYETREDHAAVARRNVSRSGLSGCWDIKIGDICDGISEEELDAAVLDIPEPWMALDVVFGSLRPGGHVGCYVPNANQLERTVKALREKSFTDVTCFETLQREMTVHERGVRPSSEMIGHTAYLAFGRKL